MITSNSNDRIKFIRKLSDRKYRSEFGMFFVEGTRIVFSAIENDADIKFLVVANDLIRTKSGKELVEQIKNNKKIEIIETSSDVFKSISGKDGPQGIGAVVQQEWINFDQLADNFNGFWIGLDRIADPGNLGTIIRTADGSGIKGVLLVGDCTDPYDPVSVRGSMGALFSLPISKTTAQDFIDTTQKNQIPVIGTSDSSTLYYRDFPYPKRMFLMMGSEREGLDNSIFQICDTIVSLPMMGSSDSLNISVAAGIIAYEILHQNRQNNEGEK